MVFLILGVLLGGIILGRRRKSRRASSPGEIAMQEFYDMQRFITDKIDDPAMSEYKWRELLPLCRFADKRYRELWAPLSYPHSCEALLRSAIGEEEENAPV